MFWSGQKSYYLEYIDPESDEFKKVIGTSGIPYHPEDITPIILERIVNKRLQDRFEAHLEYVCKRRGLTHEQAIVYPTYHGTTDVALNNILENGFDIAYNRKAAYGRGTYSATNYRDALTYSKQDRAKHNFLLVCKVVKGVAKMGSLNEELDKTNYDSFTNGGSYVSCPYNEGIIPVYVIRYANYIPIHDHFSAIERRMDKFREAVKPPEYKLSTRVVHRFR